MRKTVKQMDNEIRSLKEEMSALASRKEPTITEGESMAILLKYMTEERERTNKILTSITTKITKLERDLHQSYEEDASSSRQTQQMPAMEMPVSTLDIKILNYVQSKEMVCADQIRQEMGYKGRNAACSRLNKLYKQGLLDRFQLGHKVYYKYDAGRATNILIISPPQ
jgi:hypothetical protein